MLRVEWVKSIQRLHSLHCNSCLSIVQSKHYKNHCRLWCLTKIFKYCKDSQTPFDKFSVCFSLLEMFDKLSVEKRKKFHKHCTTPETKLTVVAKI